MNSFGPGGTASSTASWIRRLAFAGLLLCFVVVVLGAYVRLNAAGLGCPDWPGCYGHITPTAAAANVSSQAAYPNMPLHVGKAWKEMIHRYAASTLGFIILIITALAISARKQRVVSLPLAVGLFITVVVQGILGMLTVTWLLKPLIVTLHLIFGLTTLSLLWWLFLSLRTGSRGGVRFAGASASTVSAYPDRTHPAPPSGARSSAHRPRPQSTAPARCGRSPARHRRRSPPRVCPKPGALHNRRRFPP